MHALSRVHCLYRAPRNSLDDQPPTRTAFAVEEIIPTKAWQSRKIRLG